VLPQKSWDVAATVKDSYHLQRFGVWIVDDPVVSIRLHQPEAQWQCCYVVALGAGQRGVHREGAGSVDGFFDTIGRAEIGSCDVTLDFEEIVNCLWA